MCWERQPSLPVELVCIATTINLFKSTFDLLSTIIKIITRVATFRISTPTGSTHLSVPSFHHRAIEHIYKKAEPYNVKQLEYNLKLFITCHGLLLRFSTCFLPHLLGFKSWMCSRVLTDVTTHPLHVARDSIERPCRPGCTMGHQPMANFPHARVKWPATPTPEKNLMLAWQVFFISGMRDGCRRCIDIERSLSTPLP